LADCGNLKFPDLNCTDFGEKNVNFTDFGGKKLVLGLFYLVFVRKKFFDPNLRGGSPEKFVLRIGKIWHRGNFRPKIVIFESGCGNLP
jgi:hypothetical protein